MNTWGWTPAQVTALVNYVSAFEYDGNLIIDGARPGGTRYYYDAEGDLDWEATEQVPANSGITVVTASTGRLHWKLRVDSSKGPGHRVSTSGRRLVAACWHAHRDVMRTLFDHNPDGKIVTASSRYENLRDFELLHRDTYHRNAGSFVDPRRYGELCDCGTNEDGNSIADLINAA